MIDKFVTNVVDHYKGTLLQVGSMSIMLFGYEVAFEKICIFGGFLISISAFIIQVKSSRLQNRLNEKELELAEIEAESLRLQNEILKHQNPDFIDENGKIKKPNRRAGK